MVAGARVRQGQIVAFVGASGLATGPHLHYEVFEGGRRIDPRSASALTHPARTVAQDPNFRARRAEIDAAVSILAAACAAPGLIASSLSGRCIG
jgi:murein DD-endopeptidase MepM/ murein hydrolase activator NlpD